MSDTTNNLEDRQDRWWARLRRWWKGTSSAQGTDRKKRTTRRLKDKPRKRGSSKTVAVIYEAVHDEECRYFEMGLDAGRDGLRIQNVDNVANQTARSLQAMAETELKGALAEHDKNREQQHNRVAESRKRFDVFNKYWQRVKRHQTNNQRYYSRRLGVFYLLIAFALILADIPLAIEVAEQGFQIPGEPPPLPGAVDLTTDNLFSLYFFTVLAENWKPIVFSLGIAFSAFYIKVFYDEFIGWPLSRRVQRFKDYEEEHGFNYKDEEITDLRDTWKKRKRAKKGILLFTVATLIGIGILRADVEVEADGSWTLYILFPMVTLLLPLIGGIFASIGISCFQNNSTAKQVQRELDELDHALKDEQKELAEHEGKEAGARIAFRFFTGRVYHEANRPSPSDMETMDEEQPTPAKEQTETSSPKKSNEFIEEVKAILTDAYREGYDRGFATLEPFTEPNQHHAEMIRRKLTHIRFASSPRRSSNTDTSFPPAGARHPPIPRSGRE